MSITGGYLSMENKKFVKRNVFQGLGFRIGISIAVVIFIVLGLKTTYDAFTKYNSEYTLMTAANLERTKTLASELSATLNSALDLTEQTSFMLESVRPGSMERADLIEALKKIIQESKSVSSIAVCYEPNAFDGKDKELGEVSPYSSVNGRMFVFVEDDGTVEYINDLLVNPREPWYYVPISENRILISEPYQYGNNIIITFSAPIRRNGIPVGVVAADINVTFLQSALDASLTDAENSIFVATKAGIIVADTARPENVLKNYTEFTPQYKAHIDKILELD